MTNKIIFLLFIFTLVIQTINAQKTIPDKTVIKQPNISVRVIEVKAVQLVEDSSVRHGNSSAYLFYFKAIISSIGSGVVSYQWVYSNPVTGAVLNTIPGTLTLSGTGTDIILLTQGSTVAPNRISLQVLTPNSITSNSKGI